MSYESFIHNSAFIIYHWPWCIATIKLLLRLTLVLQQLYSAIVAAACPERSEGFGNFIQLFISLLQGQPD
jgi:hypothetical protein